MADIELTVEGFRAAYPVYASEEKYPDAQIQAILDQTNCMIKPEQCKSGTCTIGLYYLMAAHILTVQINGATGNVTSSKVDKVSVSISAPNFGSSGFKHWMGLSPYGIQALAMIKICGGGMIGIGGSRSGIRNQSGRF